MKEFVRKCLVSAIMRRGWRTQERTIAFMVDDYGNARLREAGQLKEMEKRGLKIGSSRFNRLDTLESNEDLEALFEVLAKYRDRYDRSPCFSPLVVVTNPDYRKIRESEYNEYHYESIEDTASHFSDHDRVVELWREGIRQRIFVPEFHGREHLRVRRWLRDLAGGSIAAQVAFEHNFCALHKGDGDGVTVNYSAAFEASDKDEIEFQEVVVADGLRIFRELTGYPATVFSAPNGIMSHLLDEALSKGGVKCINVAKIDRDPLERGIRRNRLRTFGETNHFGQRYFFRTALFEPAASIKDWVSSCLKDISDSFRWHKPAIVSSHRVNFSGHLDPNNRASGLRQLDALLKAILSHWPEVRFVSMRDICSLLHEESQAS